MEELPGTPIMMMSSQCIVSIDHVTTVRMRLDHRIHVDLIGVYKERSRTTNYTEA